MSQQFDDFLAGLSDLDLVLMLNDAKQTKDSETTAKIELMIKERMEAKNKAEKP